jgi:hypothetical protein
MATLFEDDKGRLFDPATNEIFVCCKGEKSRSWVEIKVHQDLTNVAAKDSFRFSFPRTIPGRPSGWRNFYIFKILRNVEKPPNGENYSPISPPKNDNIFFKI